MARLRRKPDNFGPDVEYRRERMRQLRDADERKRAAEADDNNRVSDYRPPTERPER